MQKEGESGDFIWNVAALPEDVAAAIKEVERQIAAHSGSASKMIMGLTGREDI